MIDKAQRYAQADLVRLREDPEFQRRVGADEEIARLFNPQCEDTQIRAELAQGLGMSRRIAGVDVPPATLGMFVLLTAAGNEFAKAKRDWSAGLGYMVAQFTEALFILSNGPKAVVSFADVFRYQKKLDAWRKDAAGSQHIAQVCLDAERKASESLRLWDAAVLAWGASHVRLSPGDDLLEVIGELDDWINRGLEGFALFPDVQRPEDKEGDAKGRSPFGLVRRLRLILSRALVRCAQVLLPRRYSGVRL